MAAKKQRCLACNSFCGATAKKCPNCSATDQFEKVIVADEKVKLVKKVVNQTTEDGELIELELKLPEVEDIYTHQSGVRFFAYEEAAKIGAEIPDFARDLLEA